MISIRFPSMVCHTVPNSASYTRFSQSFRSLFLSSMPTSRYIFVVSSTIEDQTDDELDNNDGNSSIEIGNSRGPILNDAFPPIETPLNW